MFSATGLDSRERLGLCREGCIAEPLQVICGAVLILRDLFGREVVDVDCRAGHCFAHQHVAEV